MQIRAEEQDDEDKQEIALMGRKDPGDNTNQSMSVNSEANTMASFQPRNDFPQPIGSAEQVRDPDYKPPEYRDRGLKISKKDQAIKDSMPKPRGTLTLDPVCLSCTNMQSDIMK